MRRRFSVLHLSDLHFGEIEGIDFKHKWPDHAEGLVVKCREALRERAIQPDFVVISGDLICDGRKLEQYNAAKDQVEKLSTGLGITPERLIMIPGNHDVDREQPDDRKRLSAFRTVLDSVYADASLRSRVPPDSWDSHAENNYNGWSPIVSVQDFPVDFILLYSCFTRKDKLIPNSFRKELIGCAPQLEEKAWSLFDRGFVSRSQLKSLPLPPYREDRIRIAVVHHNLMPIPRDYDSDSEVQQPDSNLLSNGMEVVEELINNGVALILHGHRHQYALTVRSQKTGDEYLTVLGAPTAGLHHEKYLGFNLVDLTKHNLGWAASITTFKYGGDGAQKFSPVSDDAVEINLCQRPHRPHPYKLLSNRHAVQSLADKLLRSRRGPSILHFTSKANWHDHPDVHKVDPTSDDSPFMMIWEDDKDSLHGLTEILFEEFSPTTEHINVIKALIFTSKQQGYYDADFLKRLRARTNRLRFSDQTSNGNTFASRISALSKTKSHRGINYAIELLRLATDADFIVTKGIHLCPCADSDDAKINARIKYLWLVNSALACRGLLNCQLAWMPFCFQRGFNQTLVAVDDGLVGQVEPANIMIGWGPGDRPGVVADPDLTNDSDYSVMVWNEDHPPERPLGDLGRDIRGLYERIIHPLAHRLMKDFPILKDGHVYLGNLEAIAVLMGFENEIEAVRKYLAAHSKAFVRGDATITADKLNGLFRWILKRDDIEQLKGNGILPWCQHDLSLLINKLAAHLK